MISPLDKDLFFLYDDHIGLIFPIRGECFVNDFLESLYFHVMEGDTYCAQVSAQASAQAEPAYQRLLELAGAEGDKLWSAIIEVGYAEAMPSFRAGLRLGLRLLAVCLLED